MFDILRSFIGKVVPGSFLQRNPKARKRVYYSQLSKTPLGDIWLATSPQGVIAIDFDISEKTFRMSTEQITNGILERSDELTGELREKLGSYLEGQLLEIDYPIDLTSATPFQRKVLYAVRGIERGATATYSDIAKLVGRPKASRAVGQALRSNPIPIVIPCHRVVNADGTLGGYGGRMGSERKINLLKIEGAILA